MKHPKPSSSSPAAGAAPSKSAAPSAPSAAADRKSRWESSTSDPRSPAAPRNPNPNSKPPSANHGPRPGAAGPGFSAAAGRGPGAVFGAGAGPSGGPHSPLDRGPGFGGGPVAPGGPHSPRDGVFFPMVPVPGPVASYGFTNLERRTIALADGSVRSYFALPADYSMDLQQLPPDRFFPPQDRHFPPQFSPDPFRDPRDHFPRGPGAPKPDYWSSLNLDPPRGPLEGPSGQKRKFGDEDEFAWHRQHVLQYGNPNGVPMARSGSPGRRGVEERKMGRWGGEGFDDAVPRRGRPEKEVPAVSIDVDPVAFRKAFLKFSKVLNEDPAKVKNYLENGRHGSLTCAVCDRSSKEFTDVHSLVVHTYNAQNADLRIDHLGLHKALCVLMGWNYAKVPENTKAYHSLPADDVAANREDLILWPPTVIVHNTNLGRRKDGRMEGLGNKDMDTKLKELGFGGGKSKSIYGKEGHSGITVVKFANTPAGLEEAERLTEYFEKDNHGRNGWGHAQASQLGEDDEKNPALFKVDTKTGERKRIFFGYLATATDLGKVDLDTKKNAIIKSSREFDLAE